MLQSKIRRGELDRQITFLQKDVGSNSTNEDATDGWEEIVTNPKVWAKVVQKQGSEVVVADQIRSVQNTTFIIDSRSDLKEEMRIAYNSKVYNIISISEHESSRGFLSISADQIHKETYAS
jgi:SPP1 family predicted phage head-tail adaptor